MVKTSIRRNLVVYLIFVVIVFENLIVFFIFKHLIFEINKNKLLKCRHNEMFEKNFFEKNFDILGMLLERSLIE
jgi:hypothetical protein